MELHVYKIDGAKAGTTAVPEGLLDVTPRRDVLHAVVVWQQANRRAYNAHTKTRGEVRGGGRKPWKQKGTGRARQGSTTAVQWVGGGIAHGPRSRTVSHELPKAVRRLGLRMALADRAAGEALKVVRDLRFDIPRTSAARDVLDALGGRRTLVLVGDGRAVPGHASATERAFRNLPNVKVLQIEGANVQDILGADAVLVEESALPRLWSRLAGTKGVAA
jgi:large subunit ribosomal protein L4